MRAVGNPPRTGDTLVKTLATLALAATAGLLSFGALAGPKCTDAPREQWMPAETMKARILKDGYTIDKFKRSEEHTSELQSLMRISYAVFCLKKKKTQTTHTCYESQLQ